MTINELVEWATERGISLDTHIAVRAKDDYFIISPRVKYDQPYFGNCRLGTSWAEDNEVDGQLPKLVILDSRT